MVNEEFGGLEYEIWKVGLPVFCDQVETLLENGYMVSMLTDEAVTVNRLLNPSPKALTENKQFWNSLNRALDEES